ncbi:hypothetical protein QOZ80_2BG0175840 [Eleusine coracana subsp. coracana]|nr:hypothetical protein QOZ80_2BG0175840 [Eleusine coracana subsp. coracana]
MELAGTWRKVMPFMAMIFLQFGYGGMLLVSVVSLRQGMSHYVLVVYRNGVAAIVMAPFALWFERKTRPKMTTSVFLKIVALGLLEPVLDQNFFYMGANNTSASFSSALTNILPAVTFVNAIILRMERIKIKERRSQAKIAGTAITVCGALLMILVKGPIVMFPWSKHVSHAVSDSSVHNSGHWLLGIIMILLSCFSWSGFFILQSHTLKSYPTELSLTTLICALGAAQSAAVALVMEHDMKAWSIGFDMRLFSFGRFTVISQFKLTGLWTFALFFAGRNMFRGCVLRAGDSDQREGASFCYCFQPSLHDHSDYARLRHSF